MKTVAVLSQGCAANFGDGEKIARILFECNVHVVFDLNNERPDAFCLNLCTVKGDSTALSLVKKIAENFKDAPILVAGCVPKPLKEILLKEFKQVSISELETIRRSKKNLEAWLCTGRFLADEALQTTDFNFNTKPIRACAHVGILNISEGCMDACTFCSTHLVKGLHKSVDSGLIIDEAQKFIDDGCKELWLSGQDTGCYGFDIGLNLAKLTQKIIVNVKGDYKIRLGMGNPRHLEKYIGEMLETFEDAHVYKFMHLPVQSGSDNILKQMGRRHNAKTYATLAKAFLNRFEYFTISTDIIVGFPGETDSDFSDTLKLIEETRPTVCNITRFVAREGTIAERFKNIVPGVIKHERSKTLAKRFQKIAKENNTMRIGHTERILTDKLGKRKGTTIARDEAYRPVALSGTLDFGKWHTVKITDAEPFALIGSLIV